MSAQVKLKDAASIPAVVAALTLEEKASLVAGASVFQTAAVERLGIPAFVPADGHNGVNSQHLFYNACFRVLARQGQGAEHRFTLFDLPWNLPGIRDLLMGEADETTFADLPPTQAEFLMAVAEEWKTTTLPAEGLPTCFPPGIVMAATWDPKLVRDCGHTVAQEAAVFGMDILLGPNVNIHRDPLGGRIFESYGEDPYLASRMAVDYIQGVQSTGVAADVKHFAANNQETMRQGIDARISERALREIYLPAFKAAVQEGGCWTVMSAYNKVNGSDCALNHRLLTEILRDEWGFEGFVVSDWTAVYDRIEGLKAGNDLEMPGPQDPQVIIQAIERGELDEAVLDERVANILGVLIKLPAFTGREKLAIDREYSTRIAKAIAVNGAVLLKNEGDTLPLAKDSVIAVLGDNAVNPLPTGGGSAGVEAPYIVSLRQGLEERFGQSCVHWGDIPPQATAAIVSVGVASAEGTDRPSLALAPEDVTLIIETAAACKRTGKKCVVVLNVCGPVEMSEWIDEVDAVLLIWLGGMELGRAAAALLAGDENPSGKLPLTFPKRYADTPTAINFPGDETQVIYAEDIYVGYRYYDLKQLEPLFPFGYGLSYTRFELSNLRLSADTLDLDAGEPLAVSVDVTNVGPRAGQEVVQLYVTDVEATLSCPVKELKGFRKVALAPGETRTVTMTLDRAALQHYDPHQARWCAEPGTFRVLLGTSSQDIRLAAEFQAVGRNPYGLGPDTPINKIVAHPGAVAVLQRYLPEEIASTDGLNVILLFFPHQPLSKTWAMRFAPALRDKSEAERQEIKRRIYEELAAL